MRSDSFNRWDSGLIRPHTPTAISPTRSRGKSLKIPLHASASAIEQSATPPASPDTVHSLRILLVEDHEDTRSVLLRLMTRWGHRVAAAASVAEAREMIVGGTFDMLLSDVGLPDGTGYDVIAAWREKSDARAVAMSGYGMEADLARTQSAGFSDHLVKPVWAEKLRELLTRRPAP